MPSKQWAILRVVAKGNLFEVCHDGTSLFGAGSVVFVVKKLVCVTDTMLSIPGAMVFVNEKMFSGVDTVVFVAPTEFSDADNTFKAMSAMLNAADNMAIATNNMLSVANTMLEEDHQPTEKTALPAPADF